jgi:glycosyltransferase involved in cell wall biosynthesis
MPGSKVRSIRFSAVQLESALKQRPLERAPVRVPQRMLINDYSGHPFQVELSRELASRGHQVLHIYSADDQTPKGDLLPRRQDPPSFAVEGVSLGEPLQKYHNLAKRRRQERAYGALMCRRIDAFRPDIVIGSNNPLEAQNRIGNHCRRRGIPFIFWLQDIHSEAIKSILSQKSAAAGTLVGTWYEWIERRLLRNADHVIAIAENFLPRLESWNVQRSRVSIIENWAPKNKINVIDRDNPWRRSQGLAHKRVALYTGTIGLKHNPDLLLAAAEAFRDDADVQVVVVSEGKFATYLHTEAINRKLENLTVLPFQPFDAYSDVLASGDVLMAMIEPDAATYSVPSKVLSYLCSGRPIVLAANANNLAARTVKRASAGTVVDPRDTSRFVAAVRHYLHDREARKEAGSRARRYADATFDIERIADRFEGIFTDACALRS